MFLDMGDFVFGDSANYRKKKAAPKSQEDSGSEAINPFQKKHLARLKFADICRRDNERNRKPCPTCTTLVKPALLQQHYEAYHPSIEFPVQ